MSKSDKAKHRRRRDQARHDFNAATALARRHGLWLVRYMDSHYRVFIGDEGFNVYPGNQRVTDMADVDVAWMPVGDDDWTLLTVVRAASGCLTDGEPALERAAVAMGLAAPEGA